MYTYVYIYIYIYTYILRIYIYTLVMMMMMMIIMMVNYFCGMVNLRKITNYKTNQKINFYGLISKTFNKCIVLNKRKSSIHNVNYI